MNGEPRLNIGRAITHGVIAGLVAAGLFYLAYQAILHTLLREVDSAARESIPDLPTIGHDEPPADNGAGPAAEPDAIGGEFGGSGHTGAGEGSSADSGE